MKNLEDVKALGKCPLWLEEDKVKQVFEYKERFNVIGFSVYDQNQNYLGIVEAIHPSPAHEILVVVNEEQSEKLIPYIKPFVLNILKKEQKIVVDFSILENLYED